MFEFYPLTSTFATEPVAKPVRATFTFVRNALGSPWVPPLEEPSSRTEAGCQPSTLEHVLTLLGKSRRAIFNAMGVSVTKGRFRSPRPPNVVSKTTFPRVLDLTNRVGRDEGCVQIRKSDDLDNACAKSQVCKSFWPRRLPCKSSQGQPSAAAGGRSRCKDVD